MTATPNPRGQSSCYWRLLKCTTDSPRQLSIGPYRLPYDRLTSERTTGHGAGGTPMRITVCVDRPAHAGALRVDGAQAMVWRKIPMDGRPVVGFATFADTTVHVRDFSISTWDGRLHAAVPLATRWATDRVRARNGDRLSGTVRDLADGAIVLTSKAGELRVPLEEASEIRFASKPARPEGMRLELIPDGRLTLQRVDIDDGEIRGDVADGSRVTIPLARVRAVYLRAPFEPVDDREASSVAASAPGPEEQEW
jgi:hypothetical protein